jgi:hypothetical protein
LLGLAAFAAGVWCASAGAGPYPFYQRLTTEWLAGPWPPVSALLCALTLLLPLRLLAALFLRETADNDGDNVVPSDWAQPNRRRDPVMYLATPTARDEDQAAARPSRVRRLASCLLSVLMVTSILGSLAGGILWWRGTTSTDYLGWSADGVHLGLLSEDGIVRLEYTRDETIPAGWRAISADPSPRLGGWQSSWRGDLAHATRVGGAYGVAWQERRTTRSGYKFGDRPRRSVYLSHPFLVGVGLLLPLAYAACRAAAARQSDGDDDFVV